MHDESQRIYAIPRHLDPGREFVSAHVIAISSVEDLACTTVLVLRFPTASLTVSWESVDIVLTAGDNALVCHPGGELRCPARAQGVVAVVPPPAPWAFSGQDPTTATTVFVSPLAASWLWTAQDPTASTTGGGLVVTPGPAPWSFLALDPTVHVSPPIPPIPPGPTFIGGRGGGGGFLLPPLYFQPPPKPSPAPGASRKTAILMGLILEPDEWKRLAVLMGMALEDDEW